MKLKYCPNCAGIGTMQEKGGIFKCWRCNFVGTPSEGAVDQINTLTRRIKGGGAAISAPSQPGHGATGVSGSHALKENLQRLKGKKTDDFEFL